MGEMGVNIIEPPSPQEFLRSHWVVGAKTVTSFGAVFNVCGENTQTSTFRNWGGVQGLQ